MGLQLIFVVETDKKCNSDWMYIKDTVEHFYEYERTQIKFSQVYMGGKWKYTKMEKEINSLISRYNRSADGNKSVVIFCFDCDEYDVEHVDEQFLKDSKKYCDDKGYEFVWFCKDIERVYLGTKVDDKKKKDKASKFKEKRQIEDVNPNRLSARKYQANSSNIMTVLDKFEELRRKAELPQVAVRHH